MLFVFGVTDLGQRDTGGWLGRFGQGVHHVRHFVDPTPLMRGVGEDVGEGTPKAQCTVPDGEDRGPHAPAFEGAQHVGPRLGRFSMPVGDRDQFFGPVSAHTHDDQDTQPGLFETDPEVDPIRPDIDVVDVFEGTVGELGAFTLPIGGQPVITEADSPAAEPKNSSRAGAKSPELMPCRYISGSTSATLGDFLAHGGRSSCGSASAPRSLRRPGGR